MLLITNLKIIFKLVLRKLPYTLRSYSNITGLKIAIGYTLFATTIAHHIYRYTTPFHKPYSVIVMLFILPYAMSYLLPKAHEKPVNLPKYFSNHLGRPRVSLVDVAHHGVEIVFQCLRELILLP